MGLFDFKIFTQIKNRIVASRNIEEQLGEIIATIEEAEKLMDSCRPLRSSIERHELVTAKAKTKYYITEAKFSKKTGNLLALSIDKKR